MAHTFENLEFEIQGATLGEASAWSRTVLSSAIGVANFGVLGASPYESWSEGWSTSDFIYALPTNTLAVALFPSGDPAPNQAENFEYEWLSNQTWSGVLGLTDDGEFDGGATDESFEAGYTNDTWEGSLSSTADGSFSGETHESFDFDYPQNVFGYWPVLSEVQKATLGLDGASPSELPVGSEYLNSPRRIVLPAAYFAAGGLNFEEVGFKAGDLFWSQGSDLAGSIDLFTITAVSGGTVTVGGATTWTTPGVSTTPTRFMEMVPALLVTGANPAPGVLDEHEYFDASAWEEMDTL